jgi:hypothetical protein
MESFVGKSGWDKQSSVKMYCVNGTEFGDMRRGMTDFLVVALLRGQARVRDASENSQARCSQCSSKQRLVSRFQGSTLSMFALAHSHGSPSQRSLNQPKNKIESCTQNWVNVTERGHVPTSAPSKASANRVTTGVVGVNEFQLIASAVQKWLPV